MFIYSNNIDTILRDLVHSHRKESGEISMNDIVIESKAICLDYPIQTDSTNTIKIILKEGL